MHYGTRQYFVTDSGIVAAFFFFHAKKDWPHLSETDIKPERRRCLEKERKIRWPYINFTWSLTLGTDYYSALQSPSVLIHASRQIKNGNGIVFTC